ncbi:cbb3-type cytochrome c oxidase subunit I [Deinococcus cellulosilyticus]|uniref:cytochrome-c oxidase n=1 Tax=Deinococcus cellulosilyticus (strain DSM 18568 / NBRC 106333 / KACC 11606 / 5516J-15) TaxID=1223518 RepID=A0A511N6J0_DEIC1|nr:cbb3-type cytochrome c oxidase subunit I [Deinococcus cellulosilyticus]GEM48021.1 cytochrome c oxidase subunit III [Deinococcus cellulosilyticus NBRC 106333 = KACC 11606]
MAVNIPSSAPSRKPGFWEVLWDYMTTGDHKKIGIMYMLTSVLGFAIAGLLAVAIRVQLAVPNNEFLVGQQYNEVLTMHGAIMLFYFIIPFGLVGFGNYLLPLQLGERDVALPRVNTFAFYLFLFSLILVAVSFFIGGPAAAGWTFYYPLTMKNSVAGSHGVEVLMVSILLNGLASLLGSANFAATVMNLRAKGMGVFKMPMFVWGILATSILQLIALSGLTAAALTTLLELKLGLSLFNPANGGVPVLFQQFFWFYSHPAVYVMLLPYLGIAAEIVSTFSRKPLFGYKVMVYSILGIVLVGLLVWVHHMFAVGLPQGWQLFFAIATVIVGVPTGVKLFNLIGTMWGGHLQMKSPLYWVIAFIFNFTIGGITGVALGLIPFDYAVTDGYFVVAHFHNVLMFGTSYLVMAGLYYWWPKITGRLMSEKMGLWHLWLFLIGSWMTFMPQYILGFLGMPRRYYTYPEGNYLWNELNYISTIGAFILLIGGLVWVYNMVWSLRNGEKANDNPWGGYTLEWLTSSPPAPHNFEVVLPTHFASERPLYDWKKAGVKFEPVNMKDVHLPQPTIWPFVSALGLLLFGLGISYSWFNVPLSDPWAVLLWVGFGITLYGIFKWAGTPEFAEPAHHHVLTSVPNGAMGMWWFFISEVTLFGVLISGYVYLRMVGKAPPPEERPDIWLAALNTLILVSSSFVIHKAEQDFAKGIFSKFRLGLMLTMILGGIFFLFQTYEFVKFGLEVDYTQNVWAACFFTLVGLHGLHIIIGGVGVALPYYQALTGKLNHKEHGSLTPASMYWHLVDVVWLVIITIFYIW